jgi:hypothetical protein
VARLRDRLGTATVTARALCAIGAVNDIRGAVVEDIAGLVSWVTGDRAGRLSRSYRSSNVAWERHKDDSRIVPLVEVINRPATNGSTSTGSLGLVGRITPLIAERVVHLGHPVRDRLWR